MDKGINPRSEQPPRSSDRERRLAQTLCMVVGKEEGHPNRLVRKISRGTP